MTADNPFATLIDTDALDWIETPGGNSLKPLWGQRGDRRVVGAHQSESGHGQSAPHALGPADFYVITGSMEYRGGFARAGAWVYEPAGAVHEATSHPEDTVYLANVRGPIAYHGP
jgi:hypothetical protein